MTVIQQAMQMLAITALVALGVSLAHANDDVAKINSANQLLVDGKLDDALAQYESIAQAMPVSPLLAYNRGVALYRQGQVEQARQSFTTALDTEDPGLAAKAGFNLGNCHYAAAVQQSETDRTVAIDSLKTAIAHYRSALKSNPDDSDSRTNIELAQQLIKKLQIEDQQDQQQQDQPKQDQPQENQKSQQQDSNQSDSEQGKSDDRQSNDEQSDEPKSEKNSADQSSANQPDSPKEEPDASKSDDSQPDDSKSGEPESNDQSDPDEESGNQSADSKSDNSKPEPNEQQDAADSDNEQQAQRPAQQQSAGRQADPSEPDVQKGNQQPQPGDSQDSPSEPEPGRQMPAAASAQPAQPGDGQPLPGYAVSQTGDPGENMDQEEAMKMLQAIRDRDLMRRMQKLNETRRQHRSVDRDW